MKTFIVSTILALTPVLAQAECSWGKETTAMSCAEGTVFDQEKNACVTIIG